MKSISHLQRLEAESIHIMREVVAECQKPAMLYSAGVGSSVMVRLARKAFYPATPPFPLLHLDTTWMFRAACEFRDSITNRSGMELIVHVNEEGLRQGISPITHGAQIYTEVMKTEALRQAIDKHSFDAILSSARRETRRATQNVFSFLSAQHQWHPEQQRPELWSLYNSRKAKGETIRVFPLSNWTELDVWQYVHLEKIPIVSLYFADDRPVVERNGSLITVDDNRLPLRIGERPMIKKVRFRNIGCYALDGAIVSEATTLLGIIQEMLNSTRTSGSAHQSRQHIGSENTGDAP